MIFALPQVSSRLPQNTSSELQIELQPSDCEAHTRDSLGKTTTPLTVPLSGRASADFSSPSRLPGERILELIQVRQAHVEPETKTESGDRQFRKIIGNSGVRPRLRSSTSPHQTRYFMPIAQNLG